MKKSAFEIWRIFFAQVFSSRLLFIVTGLIILGWRGPEPVWAAEVGVMSLGDPYLRFEGPPASEGPASNGWEGDRPGDELPPVLNFRPPSEDSLLTEASAVVWDEVLKLYDYGRGFVQASLGEADARAEQPYFWKQFLPALRAPDFKFDYDSVRARLDRLIAESGGAVKSDEIALLLLREELKRGHFKGDGSRAREIIKQVEEDHHPAALSERLFRHAVDSGDVSISHPDGLGEVQATHIDSIPIIRVLHAPTETVYAFVDADLVKRSSDHMEQYVARQLLFSGHGRKDEQKGRDVVIVWLKDDHVTDVEFHRRPKKWSGSYWKRYAAGVLKTPTSHNVVFGLLCGTVQMGFGTFMGLVKMATASTGTDMNWLDLLEPGLLNFAFGTTIGILSSTYRNWLNASGSNRWTYNMKQMSISLLYAYSLFNLTHGPEAELTLLNMEGLINHLSIFLNVLMTSLAKTEWWVAPRVLEAARRDLKKFTIKLPGMKPVVFTERDINFQLKYYLPQQAIRMADLMGISLVLGLGAAGSEIGIPIGKVLLFSSIPLVYLVTREWAIRKYPEAAKKLGLDRSYKEVLLGLAEKLSPGAFVEKIKQMAIPTDDEIKRTPAFKKMMAELEEQVTQGVVDFIGSHRGSHVDKCRYLLRSVPNPE